MPLNHAPQLGIHLKVSSRPVENFRVFECSVIDVHMQKPGEKAVMISSTSLDLPAHREKAKKACLDMKVHPVMMENLPVSDDPGQWQSAIKRSIQMVDEADVYIGIFGRRYGHIPAGYTVSVTEMEYDRAVKRGIPILVFLMHKDHLLPAEMFEADTIAQEKLKSLKEKAAKGRIRREFVSADELYAGIVQGLAVEPDPWTFIYPAKLLESSLSSIDRLHRPLHQVAELHKDWCVMFSRGKQNYPSLMDAAREHRMLLLTGSAGSGKTIALKQLFRAATELAVEQPEAARPVWLQASAFTADVPTVTNVTEFVIEQALEAVPHSTLKTENVRRAIAEGRCLFLLDGLDELPRELWKERMQALWDFFQTYGNNRVVITTRPATVAAEWRISELPMPRLSAGAQQELVAGHMHGTQLRPEQFARWLQGDGRALRDIADNPFFLHLLTEWFLREAAAQVDRRSPEQPALLLLDIIKRRLIEEYSTHVRTAWWRRLSADGWNDEDMLDACLPVLGAVGFAALCNQSDRVLLSNATAFQSTLPAGKAPRDTFLHSAGGLGIYSIVGKELVFTHLLWRDLLAANHMAALHETKPDVGIPAEALEGSVRTPWKQALVFLTQLLSAPALTFSYHTWLASDHRLLAGLIADDAAVGGIELQRDLAARFTVEVGRKENDVAMRRLVAEALSRVGDPRLWEDSARPLVPALVDLPQQTCRIGLSQEDRRKLLLLQKQKIELELDDEEFQCAVPSLPSFAIARYPTTNAQFRLFVENGGFAERVWWDETSWQWLQDNGGKERQPDHWSDRRFNADNQPVVGITFHEATAYTRWLTTHAGDGRYFRLATVAEWQAAARGPQGWLYPWGDEPMEDRCNCWHGADLGTTSPVGIYIEGMSPSGVYDLAGNVSEWAIMADGTTPVICGGSWFSSIHRCRATQFRAETPEIRGTEIGFRIVAIYGISQIGCTKREHHSLGGE